MTTATVEPTPAHGAVKEVARSGGLTLAGGLLWGWVCIAVVAVTTIVLNREPTEDGSLMARVCFFAAGQLLAIGLAVSAVVELWRRFLRTRWNYVAVCGVTGLLGWWMLPEDFANFAGKLPGPTKVWVAVFVAATAVSIPAAAWLGRLTSLRPVRGVLVLLGLGVAWENQHFATHDYPGLHFFLALGAATLIGGALAGKSPARPGAVSVWRNALRFMVAIPAAVALVVPPSNTVGVHLYRGARAVAAPWVVRLQQAVPTQGNPAFKPGSSRWFVANAHPSEQRPTGFELLPEHPIVILFVVDAMRGDLINGDHAERLPNFTRLTREGVQFVNARSTAPATIQSISSLTTSRYYSQIQWETKRKLSAHCYPYPDKNTRFTELLSKSGITTATRAGLPGFQTKFHVFTHIKDEMVVGGGRKPFPSSAGIVPEVIARLRRTKADESLFMYVHVDDPHDPYTLGAGGKTNFERYLSEVAVVDTQLGLVMDAIKRNKLEKRTMLIVTADHGEAFGEHGQRYHTTTLYDELLHVPLVARFPGAMPRKVKVPVSLVDLAPTILDLFGLSSPGTYMGQSLVPLLAGQKARLDRPIVADSPRLMRAMVFDDGMKLIVNTRTQLRELYDLNKDPGEETNIYDEHPEAQVYDQLMRTFFEVHQIDVPGYEVKFCR
ncbi:MAG: sulfatase [Myxococcales bacterium]|nr:sulfatase [Myxococcales bacterium]